MFAILFLLFTLVPALELYLLIAIGSRIGATTTIALVILTGIVGAGLAKAQGFLVLQKIQHNLANGQMPALNLTHGAFVLVGGLLLLTPGFLTDVIGFSFLLPFTRYVYIGMLQNYFKRRIQNSDAIKVEYREL